MLLAKLLTAKHPRLDRRWWDGKLKALPLPLPPSAERQFGPIKTIEVESAVFDAFDWVFGARKFIEKKGFLRNVQTRGQKVQP